MTGAATSAPATPTVPNGRSAPLRVALIPSCPHFEGFFGGVQGLSPQEYVHEYRGDFIADYTAGLRREGVASVVYMPSLGARGRSQADDGFDVRFLPLGRVGRGIEKLTPIARGRLGRYGVEAARTRSLLPTLRQALAADGIDLVYLQEYWTPRFDVLTRALEVPVVAADHGGRRAVNLDWFKKRSLRRAARLTCLTSDQVRELAALGATGEYLPNGVDTDRFRPAEADEAGGDQHTDTVLCVARLNDAQKRVSDLIRALEHLPESYRLLLAGAGPDEQELRNLAARLGVGERVQFLGRVTRERVLELLQSSSVFALVSAWEGLPLAAIEAMSCGASTVVSDIPAFRDLASSERIATVVPGGDVRAIAAGIQRANQEKATIGPAARQHVVENFSSSALYRRLARLLTECAAEGSDQAAMSRTANREVTQ